MKVFNQKKVCCLFILFMSFIFSYSLLGAEKEGSTPKFWRGKLKLGSNFSLFNNTDVVGNIEGMSLSFGAIGTGTVTYWDMPHEWRNSISLTESVSRTAGLNRFVKTLDVFEIKTMYFHHLNSDVTWGPFGGAGIKTSLLMNYDVRSSDSTYTKIKRDGTTETKQGTKLRLTDPIAPFQIRALTGAFVWPVEREEVIWEMKIGLEGRKTFADRQFAVRDDAATDEIEVTELPTVYQLGTLFTTSARGHMDDRFFEYEVFVDLMYPFLTSGSNAQRWEIQKFLNWETGISIVFQIIKWISLDYQISLIKEPKIFNKVQAQNSLLLNFGWSFLSGV